MNAPHDILKRYWGFDTFRPLQSDIIASVLNGNDTVALLPTGGGKSVCFQVPALAQEGLCIVIAPLIALMNDQVAQLHTKGIKALALTGGLSTDELVTLLDNARYGNYKFLYLSPERLQQELVQQAIRQLPVNLIAIDEAHCISQWGNDFRPAYRKITLLREMHPMVPMIALTATATSEVLEDTISELKLEHPRVFRDSFERAQLSYQVYKEEDKRYRVMRLLRDNSGSAIIYVRSRSMAVETSAYLNNQGIASTYYHGGVSSSEKKQRLEEWRNGVITTMVATNAFGMGIDHPSVRFVIHIQLPESLESYFQEAGRAGRDGNPASAVLLYTAYDKKLATKQFIASLPDVTDLKFIYKKLCNYFQIPYGEGAFTEHAFSFSDFCTTYELPAAKTYHALTTFDRLGILQLSRQFGRKSMVQFLVPSKQALGYFEKNMTAAVVGKTILRIYGGIFETALPVNLDLVAKKTGQSLAVIIKTLETMERDGIISLKLHETDASITFIEPREDDKTINRLATDVTTLNSRKEQQLQAVIRYVSNEEICRSMQLLAYFGETTATPCGICSVCRQKDPDATNKELRHVAHKILLLLEESEMSSRELSEKLTFAETKIVRVLQNLLDAGQIVLNARNQYTIK